MLMQNEGNHTIYSLCGIKFKIKIEPSQKDIVNLVFDDTSGIGNRIFPIISCCKYFEPKIIKFLWPKNNWVTSKMSDLFSLNLPCKLVEYNDETEILNWKNCKKEITITKPSPFIVTKDKIVRNLWMNNLTSEIKSLYVPIFKNLKPSNQVLNRIKTQIVPENFVALQIRNNLDWQQFGRNEDLNSFLKIIQKYPKDTVFYLSAMNKDTSNFIKENINYNIIELDNKNYNSMIDAVTDLYIMSFANKAIYSFGSTFAELSYWLSGCKQEINIVGNDEKWIWKK